jgi:predicted naringenin-chalcone synthase
MVVNHFGMRPDVQSYHLGGMGCSNGVVAVNLVKDLLRVSRKQRHDMHGVVLTLLLTACQVFLCPCHSTSPMVATQKQPQEPLL